jgi:hypothetical protein
MPKSDLALDLSGYAPVADRVALFYQKYPNGRIVTELVSRAGGEIIFKASVFRDASQASAASTGWAAEKEGDGEVNTVACLENTETSAIGRALANLGFTASARRPSREEMQKTDRARGYRDLHAKPIPLRAVREQNVRLERAANAAHDVLDLLHDAERRGFPPKRAELIRERVTTLPALELRRIERLEARVRQWLRRVHQDWM